MTTEVMREPGEDSGEMLGIPRHRPGAANRLAVWQYEIPASAYPRQARIDGVEPGFVVEMPEGAELLGVHRTAVSGAVLFAWVNPAMPAEKRFFYIVKTNAPMGTPEDAEKAAGRPMARLEHVSTWEGWRQFWHLFEAVPAERAR